MTNLLTLTRMRVRLALRNKMFFFFSVVMPLGFFFLYAAVFAKGIPREVAYLLGPVLALNVMGSFWGLSATLVMFREEGAVSEASDRDLANELDTPTAFRTVST